MNGFTEEWLREYQAKHGKSQPVEVVNVPDNKKKAKCPNKTEGEYHRLLSSEFPMCAPKFEAMTLYLDNGHRYTPDFAVNLLNGQILLVEVKNAAYKHASYGRSRMAFDQCRIDWPQFRYRWAEKTSQGWIVQDF